jgi:uncharacterized protein (DUF2345 family)
MAIENQADLARVAKLIEELKQAVGLVPVEGEPVPDDGAAAPADAGGDQFSTPALATAAPASVPTIEPVPEDQVPDEVKAADQGGQG